eukprot:scaffold144077_cov31-Tisochrysis_lutea.AAC.6
MRRRHPQLSVRTSCIHPGIPSRLTRGSRARRPDPIQHRTVELLTALRRAAGLVACRKFGRACRKETRRRVVDSHTGMRGYRRNSGRRRRRHVDAALTQLLTLAGQEEVHSALHHVALIVRGGRSVGIPAHVVPRATEGGRTAGAPRWAGVKHDTKPRLPEPSLYELEASVGVQLVQRGRAVGGASSPGLDLFVEALRDILLNRLLAELQQGELESQHIVIARASAHL